MSSGLPTKIARSRSVGVARDVLDHLGVVVGGQVGLVLAAVGHRQPADEVGQPGVAGALLARVLVQVVVELPGLVADPQVVALLARDVVEDHEVVDQDLVHPAPRLEAVQVVLGRLGLDVLRLVRQVLAAGVDALALALEHARDRVLGEPVDLEPVDELAQLARDRDVALGVAEADRRRDVERALAPVRAVHGRVAPRRAVDELAQREVHLHGLARVRQVAGALDRLEPAAGDLRERLAVGVRRDPVLGAVDHEHRAAHALGELGLVAARGGRRELPPMALRASVVAVGLVRPRDRVLDLLRRVRLGEHPLGPPLDEVGVAAVRPVVRVELAPAARRERRPASRACARRGWREHAPVAASAAG